MAAIFRKNSWLWLLYGVAALFTAFQRIGFGVGANGYTAYENYIIFRNSFLNLVQGANPYAAYPDLQWDLFKYSPAFSLFMAPFAGLPDAVGLPLWNLLNAWALLAAILLLPLPDKKRRLMAVLVFPEMLVSIQNSQSNGLTAAMILFAWIAFERSRMAGAAWWSVGGAFLKIFGGLAALPMVLYPLQRKFILHAMLAGLILALAPMLVTGPAHLLQVYEWWWELLRSDHEASTGLSVVGWLRAWFGWEAPKTAVLTAGLLLLLGSVFRVWQQGFGRSLPVRQMVWASLLLWVILFNHKAESPTFVVAVCGLVLWFFAKDRPKGWEKIVFWLSFALVSFSASDLAPREVRKSLMEPYLLKVFPCILVWGLLTLELFILTSKRKEHDGVEL